MNLRQAAQRALKEMDDHMYRADTHEFYEAKEALRAALAEPEQEPVGHADLGINNIYIFSESEPRVVPAGRTPLYTAPTPRKPLTPDQVFAIADQHPVEGFDPEIMAFVRAIERAHGITGETK